VGRLAYTMTCRYPLF